MPVLVRGTVQMKQGEIGMSFRHAPGKFLVIGRFLEKNRICVAAVFNNVGQRAVYRPGVKPADGRGDPGRLPAGGFDPVPAAWRKFGYLDADSPAEGAFSISG